ncbi:hypothetical protein K439DRAFT_833521 [Ramaria rubella]|nr:hypothetical protein K439DRAFT_833521 [Ramaria rubella]
MSVQHRTLEVAEDVPFTEKDDLSPTEDQATSVAAESPLSMEPSSRSQSGEAEVSSSQSSSIDPHTPSINGDLAPHTCDNGIIAKHDFSTHIEQFTHDRERRAPLESIPPSVNVDPLSHWSRLMTRLNHSEESSPLGTPQTVTPTPPVGPAPAERESLHGSPPHGESMGGRPVVRPLHQEYSDVSIPQRTLKKHSNVGARPSSISSSFHPQGLPGRSTAEISIGSAATSPTLQTSTSTDVLTKRTRQLQLLDGVLAEELIKRTPPTPMSAHVLGAFPNTSGGPLLDHVRTLVRPASVDTDAIHTLSTPLHHQPLFPIPALPDVLPAPVRAPLQHQFIRPVPPSHHLPQYLARSNGWNSSVGRPSSAMPSSAMASSTMQLQPPSASYPTTNLTQHSDDVNASTHRGQMLSILSGALPLRPPAGGTFRSGSALYDSGEASDQPIFCKIDSA